MRNALSEFRKFDLEGEGICTPMHQQLLHAQFLTGWIDKAVLFPVMKACFTYSLPEKEIRTLLGSPTLKSMVSVLVNSLVIIYLHII